MKEDLVLAAFLAMPFVVGVGLYLFFGKYGLHEGKKLPGFRLLLGNLLVLSFSDPSGYCAAKRIIGCTTIRPIHSHSQRLPTFGFNGIGA